jgi:ubiquinone/menaquinone biosynthesis C-methylase UbiE
MTQAASADRIIGAAGRFTPVGAYDLIVRLTMREGVWRGALARDLAVHVPDAGAAITEVGAGTGSLTAVLRRALPGAKITAVEPDPRAAAIGRKKVGSDDETDWQQARAESLPVENDSQDAVVMALMLHHLGTPAKLAALAEAHRVLRPGGHLWVADFGTPHDPLMAAAFTVIQIADGLDGTAPHRGGALPSMIRDGGFETPVPLTRVRTAFGSVEVLRAAQAAY